MAARERDSGPRSLGASLDEVTKRLGVDDAHGLGRLFAHWEEIVGPSLAEHVQPLRVDRDRLVVTVDHPAWATQVRHLGAELLDRVTEEAGLPRPAGVEVRIRR